MDSYAPAVKSGSVVDDYFSRVYSGVYDLLSKLKARATTFLEKFDYRSIGTGIAECEKRVQEVHALRERVGELRAGVDSINQRLDKSEVTLGKLRNINVGLSEIVGALDRGGTIGDYMKDLEALSMKSSKL